MLPRKNKNDDESLILNSSKKYLDKLEVDINSGEATNDIKGPIDNTLRVSRTEEVIIRN